MSRIDEALRRAEVLSRPPTSQSSGDAFHSPWEGEQDAPVPPAAAGPVAQPAETLLTTVTGGALPSISARWGERLVSSPACDATLLERFRHMAGTLQKAQTATGLSQVLVTSATTGEGKTLTSINLALVLSESYGRRVLLIDADLRRPSIGAMLDLPNLVGLSTALKSPVDQKLALVPLTPTLMLLPAGAPDPDPLSGLTSARMRRILDEAAGRFDWVILDGPPTGPLAETSHLANMVQGTVFVLRAGETQNASVQRSIEMLGRDRILGVVLNGVEGIEPEHYEAYYQKGPAQ